MVQEVTLQVRVGANGTVQTFRQSKAIHLMNERFNPAGKAPHMPTKEFYKSVVQMAAMMKRFDATTSKLLLVFHNPQNPPSAVYDEWQCWRKNAETLKKDITRLRKMMDKQDEKAAGSIYCLEGVRACISESQRSVRERYFLFSSLHASTNPTCTDRF